jgi:AbrB family looped-hinge helix DNA binding protein
VQGKAARVPKATLTSKGQVTLPIDVRRALRLESGDGVTFEPAGEGAYLLRPAAGDIRRLKGVVPAPAKPVSLEAMDAAIRRRARAKCAK